MGQPVWVSAPEDPTLAFRGLLVCQHWQALCPLTTEPGFSHTCVRRNYLEGYCHVHRCAPPVRPVRTFGTSQRDLSIWVSNKFSSGMMVFNQGLILPLSGDTVFLAVLRYSYITMPESKVYSVTV